MYGNLVFSRSKYYNRFYCDVIGVKQNAISITNGRLQNENLLSRLGSLCCRCKHLIFIKFNDEICFIIISSRRIYVRYNNYIDQKLYLQFVLELLRPDVICMHDIRSIKPDSLNRIMFQSLAVSKIYLHTHIILQRLILK